MQRPGPLRLFDDAGPGRSARTSAMCPRTEGQALEGVMERADVALTTGLDAAEEAEAEAHLYACNVARSGVADGEKVAYALRDGQGTLLGLVAGWTWGGCLDLRLLWV